VIVPRVQADMDSRIEVFKAGETIIHQINFLFGDAASQETPPVDTTRFELAFPQLPPRGECNLDILDSSVWVPTVTCAVAYTECEGLHETTCGTNLNWHAEVGVRTDAVKRCIPGWAKTSGGTCKQWCGDRGFECLRAQDSHQGRCNLWPEHTRQTTAENGCLQKWADQVCECGLTRPATARLMDGCTRDSTHLKDWGLPRVEDANLKAGEAQCCTAEGKSVRHVDSGEPALNPNNAHQQCTTTSGTRLFDGDKPSHTFHEAKALCEGAGLRLCSTQEEVDTGCNTGCWLNTVVVWVE